MLRSFGNQFTLIGTTMGVIIWFWLTVTILMVAGWSLFGLATEPERSGRSRYRYLPGVLLSALLLAYLIAKVSYEEIYPCLAVDEKYCDFTTTQYHNLFGWEF